MSTFVRDLVSTPGLAKHLSVLIEADADRPVESVHVAETRAQLAQAAPCGLVIVTDPELERSPTYYLDIALRQAAEQQTTALLARGLDPKAVGLTTIHLARRAGVGLITTDRSLDLAQLVIAIHRILQADADASLARLEGVCGLLAEAEEQLDADALVRVANGSGSQFRLDPENERATPISCDGTVESRVLSAAVNPAERRIGEWMLAEAIARSTTSARRAEASTIQSRFELVTELLASDPDDARPLVRRARQLGLAIDGWHAIIAIQPDLDLDLDPLEWETRTAHIEQLAVDTARASGGAWHRARMGEHLLLVLMERDDPGGHANATLVRVTSRVMERLRRAEPELALYCGVSALHPGTTGLWSCLVEARTAARAARLGDDATLPVFFDATGVNQTIAEWYGTETARKRVGALLAPLNALDPARKTESLQTLRSYLDHGCSTSRTATALYLHRNTVAYRIQRLTEMIEIDLDDPDERLLLELACRSQQLSEARTTR